MTRCDVLKLIGAAGICAVAGKSFAAEKIPNVLLFPKSTTKFVLVPIQNNQKFALFEFFDEFYQRPHIIGQRGNDFDFFIAPENNDCYQIDPIGLWSVNKDNAVSFGYRENGFHIVDEAGNICCKSIPATNVFTMVCSRGTLFKVEAFVEFVKALNKMSTEH